MSAEHDNGHRGGTRLDARGDGVVRRTGGPRVLVTVASRHGATREIAAAIARCMTTSDVGRAIGLSTVLVPVQLQPRPSGFDAVVLGSALYAGRWLDPARLFAESAAAELTRRPTWLFSSGLDGPLGGPTARSGDVSRISAATGARGHRAFPGRVERRVLSAGERDDWGRAVQGDLRDWSAVRAWAEEIAGELMLQPVDRAAPGRWAGSGRRDVELALPGRTG